MNAQEIQEILDDWQNGKSHGQIIREHNITREQEFAIYSTTLYSDGLNVNEISVRVKKIKPGMKATEIISVMRSPTTDIVV